MEGTPADEEDPRRRPLPDPALRASDAERERIADRLRHAAGEGRLTVDELDERVDLALAARTHGELQAIVADLPATKDALGDPASSGVSVVRSEDEGTRWVVSIMGGAERKGRWRVGRLCTVLNVMGGSDIDLHGAELADDVVEIRVLSIMGGSDIRVPEGLAVEVSEFSFMGGNDLDLGDRPAPTSGPIVRLRLISILGGSSVRRGPKISRRERRRLQAEAAAKHGRHPHR